jgi:hypothetical protein
VRLTGSRSEESKAAWERASKRLDELVEHVGDEARKAAVESRKAAA